MSKKKLQTKKIGSGLRHHENEWPVQKQITSNKCRVIVIQHRYNDTCFFGIKIILNIIKGPGFSWNDKTKLSLGCVYSVNNPIHNLKCSQILNEFWYKTICIYFRSMWINKHYAWNDRMLFIKLFLSNALVSQLKK